MSALIKAEFRKIFTINLWWALLIPVAALSFFAAWLGTEFGSLPPMQDSEGHPAPVGLLTMSLATNYTTIFAAVFGGLAIAGEHRNKSITTTYLTANPRGGVLGAKLVTYANVGIGYGLVNLISATLGALVGAGPDGFGHIGQWSAVCGAALLSMVLWTLLGVGFGAMVTNAVVTVLLLVGYKFIFEFLISMTLLNSDAAWVTGYLPAAAAGGIVGNLAIPMFVTNFAGAYEPNVPQQAYEALHFLFGGTYNQPWWLSVVVFFGYTAALVLGGWFLSGRRDVT